MSRPPALETSTGSRLTWLANTITNRTGSVTWFGKQRMGELKEDCIRQVLPYVELVAFTKNGTVIGSTTYDDTTPVEKLFKTTIIVAVVGSE